MKNDDTEQTARNKMMKKHIIKHRTTDASRKIITIFGGRGFVGRHVVQAIARKGYRIRVVGRKPELAGFLLPLGDVGQIHCIRTDYSPQAIARVIQGAYTVINLTGIMVERKSHTFSTVHRDIPNMIAQAAMDAGTDHFIHMSAITADLLSNSLYARSKAEGEHCVLKKLPNAIILRPSIIFGQEDKFFNRFAALARISPFLPLIEAETRFQPVFVGDVAKAVVSAVDGDDIKGGIYELGGPDVMTLRDIMTKIMGVTERQRYLMKIPTSCAKFMAYILQNMPKSPLTVDQVTLLGTDNVVSGKAITEKRTLRGIGINPVGMSAILPSYLVRFRRTGQFKSIYQ